MVGLFLRSAEKQDGQLGMALPETTDQFQVISQGPAPAGEIFRAARTDVDAQHRPPGKILPGDEIRRPDVVVVR